MKKITTLYFICLMASFNAFYAQTGSSLHFDGIDDEVDCGNDISLQITGNTITLEAFVKFHSFTDATYKGNIINKEFYSGTDGETGYMLRAGGAGGNINFNIGSGSGWKELTTPDNTLVLDVWYHIAATYDGTTMTIYLDGVVISTHTETFTIANNSENLFIGSWANVNKGRNVNVSLDEVRIWNIARSAGDIASSGSGGLTLPQAGLVAYYKFNQGVAGGSNVLETTLNDELNTNNGTLVNFDLSSGSVSNWVSDNTLSLSKIDTKKGATLRVIPNPSNDIINIEGMVLNANSYKVHNILGKEVLSGTFSNGKQLNISSLTKGFYLIQFESGEAVKFLKN